MQVHLRQLYKKPVAVAVVKEVEKAVVGEEEVVEEAEVVENDNVVSLCRLNMHTMEKFHSRTSLTILH